jgi:hypothetical protein
MLNNAVRRMISLLDSQRAVWRGLKIRDNQKDAG